MFFFAATLVVQTLPPDVRMDVCNRLTIPLVICDELVGRIYECGGIKDAGANATAVTHKEISYTTLKLTWYSITAGVLHTTDLS